MWVLQLCGLVLIASIVLGVSWRLVEDKLEKRARARQEALDKELNDFLESLGDVNTVAVPTTKNN
jgi:hypothetical protein